MHIARPLFFVTGVVQFLIETVLEGTLFGLTGMTTVIFRPPPVT